VSVILMSAVYFSLSRKKKIMKMNYWITIRSVKDKNIPAKGVKDQIATLI